MHQPRKWTLLARILRPQGRKGEVLADLFTDFPSRFAQHPQIYLAPAGFAESDSAQSESTLQPAEIISHWVPTGRNAGRVVLHFAAIDTISQAEILVGKEVVVPSDARIPLEEGAVYISDLIGCALHDRDTLLGTVADIQFLVSADGSHRLDDAAPLLVVRTGDGAEVLVPFARSYTRAIDIAAKTIRMDLPEGLADLNPAEKSTG